MNKLNYVARLPADITTNYCSNGMEDDYDLSRILILPGINF